MAFYDIKELEQATDPNIIAVAPEAIAAIRGGLREGRPEIGQLRGDLRPDQ